MNIIGYLMIWLSVTQRIARPKTWQMYLYICIGANSQTFANTGALASSVKNFPQSITSFIINLYRGSGYLCQEFVVFVCFIILSFAVGHYILGIYSEAIKTTLGYDQETLTTLGFFKDFVGNVGIVSGLINKVTPPWVFLGIGAIMNIIGNLMVWLSVNQRIAMPKKWQIYLYICIGANSQTFANTGALVSCVKNLLGILKGFVGLSRAIFAQICHAIYGQDNTGVILLLGVLPAAVSLAVMLIVRPTKLVADKEEVKRFYKLLYITLALLGFLMIMIVVENRVKHFPQSGYQIVAALAILFLMFNRFVIVDAEMDNVKLQGLPPQSRNGFQKPVQIDVREDEVKMKNEEKPKIEISLTSYMSETNVNEQEGKRSEQPKSLRSRLIKMFKSPTRGDDYTIPRALVTVDMIIIFVATTCGVGTTLTAIDNMGQIRKALGYTSVNISTFVSLISIWNFLGLVMAGFLSEYLLHKYKFTRPLMFPIIFLIACVGHGFIAFPLPGSLYVASVIIGLSFRAQWAKSFRSFLVSGLLVINRKWGEENGKALKYLHCCVYIDLKKASLLTRNVAKGRWFVVFLCFLIMSTAQGTTMRGIYPKTQAVQTVSKTYINEYAPVVHLVHSDSETVVHTPTGVFTLEKYGATGDGKLSTQVVQGRRLLEEGNLKPKKPGMYKGPPAQHN